MDADLSTDLRALLPLVAPLLSGHSEIAIGTRLHRGARVTRGLKRELISRVYNRLLHGVLHARFSDAQCGFKAVRADVLDALLPTIRDEGWFFDTELLIAGPAPRAADPRGARSTGSTTPTRASQIVATALADLRGVARLAPDRHGAPEPSRARCARSAPDSPAPGLRRETTTMSTTTVRLRRPEPRARGRRDRLRGFVRGDVSDPAWARPALLGAARADGVAYLWNLTASGYANSFYAAAVQAGTKSWKAFFFGSLDSSSFITVDKPPASLWVMALSGRIFGFSSASMLVPAGARGRRRGRAAATRRSSAGSAPAPACWPAPCSRSRRSRR